MGSYDEKLAGDYITAYKLQGLSTTYDDASNPKTEKRLIKYVDSLEKTQFYSLDEIQSGFRKMSEDVLVMAWYYIKQFYDSSISDEKLEYFMNSIVKTIKDEYMEGMSYEAINTETHEKTRIVCIPNMDNFLSVICTTHEAMHFFTFLLNKAKMEKRDDSTQAFISSLLNDYKNPFLPK